jgi:multidrug efflux system membrane fusion protein
VGEGVEADDVTVILPHLARHRSRSSRRPMLVFITLLLIAGSGWAVHAHRSRTTDVTAKAAADRSVPIVVTQPEVREVPIYLEGLGSVAAFNTVTVRSQVDGRIERTLFTEGGEVHKDDILVVIDPRPFVNAVKRASAQHARDSALLRNARANLKRYQALRERKLIAQQQLDDQQAEVDQLRAALTLDQAQIDDAKLQLLYSRISSPIDGRTGVRLVDPGNLVRANDPNGLVLITQLDPIAVVFTLPEDELPRVQASMATETLPVEAWSRDGATLLGTGKLSLIDNQINAATGTIRLKAIFDNPQRALWPNQFVRARLLVAKRKNALVIASSVVQRGPNGDFVYVVNKGRALMRSVTIETTAGDLAIVSEGIDPTDVIVFEGQNRLAPDTRVQVTKNEALAADRAPTERLIGDSR